jgi:hypothetical protein
MTNQQRPSSGLQSATPEAKLRYELRLEQRHIDALKRYAAVNDISHAEAARRAIEAFCSTENS